MVQQSTPDPPSLPDDLLEQYDLEDEIGRSARACVYLARDRVLDQTVALKLLHPRYGADAAFASRLYLTARAAAALGHPAIAAVYDRGPFDGSTFITSEWFADGNLATLLRRSGPLTTRQVVPALARVLDALAVAHASGIVHGDLHPRNLLVRGTAAHGTLVIADFGMGFVREWAEGHGGVIDAEVAPYRAPELPPGAMATVAADLYAVATILYEALVGEVPARDGLWRRPAGIPRPLFATLERALAQDPGARYPSAIALRDAIATAVGATVPASWVAAPTGQLGEAVRVERRAESMVVARPWRSPHTAALLVTGALALGGLTGTAVFVQAGVPGFPSRVPSPTAAPPTAVVTPEGEAAPTPTLVPVPAPIVVPTPTLAAAEPTAPTAVAVPTPVATLSAGAAALAPAQGAVAPPQFTPPPRPSVTPSAAATSVPPSIVSSGGIVGVTLENFSPVLLAGAYQPLDDQRRDGAQVALYGAGSGYNVGILTFEVTVAPSGQLTLVLTGLDDEQEAHSTIQVLLNGTTLFSGASGFDNRPPIGTVGGGDLPWGQMRLVVPAGTLKLGQNSLVVRNTTAGNQLAPPYVLIHDLQIVGEAP